MTLTTTTQADPGTTCLRLAGDLDLSNNHDVEQALHAALAATPTGGRLLIDLAAVTFLDCTTIGLLLHAHGVALARGVTYQVINAHGIVLRIFNVLGLDMPQPTPSAETTLPA